ncbi:MAG: 4Fe-4S binding protein [Fretibacterium sp.]|nr:4Fe-4S binding protein [Fretibacterium sp.]
MAKGRVEVREEFCKSCGLCVAACPKKVLRISDSINPRGYRPAEQFQDGCIACGICARTCPDVVLTVYRIDE